MKWRVAFVAVVPRGIWIELCFADGRRYRGWHHAFPEPVREVAERIKEVYEAGSWPYPPQFADWQVAEVEATG